MAKVLLVEDDNNLREIYQARLMAEGYDIVAAQNGEEALVVAKQNKPDLIISDVMMPRISGFEMLDILRNTDELKHTKVIMLTALGQTEDQKRADNLGADKYLVKSQVTLEDIVNAAKELLGEDGDITDVPPAPTPIVDTAAPIAPTPMATDNTSAPQAVTTPIAEPPTPTPAPAAAVVPEPAPEPVATAPTPTAAPAAPAPTPTPAAAMTVATPAPAADVAVVPEPPVATPVTPVISMPTTEPVTPPTAAVPEPAVTPVAPAPVTPAPDTTSTPVSDAAPVQSPLATPETAAQTLEAEEAALQAQIKTYADAPAPAAMAVEPSASNTASVAANNDAAIANAVQQLNAPADAAPVQPPSVANAPTPAAEPAPVAASSTPEPSTAATPIAEPPTSTPTPAAAVVPEPAPEPVAPAPAPTAASAGNNADSLAVAGRKVIQPITPDTAKPNLDELLAKEASTEPAPAAVPVVNGAAGAAPATPPMPPHTPGQSFDPNKAL